MSQRFQVTKWLCLIVALYSGPALSPVRCVSVRPPPKTPSTIEAQAKFFQYRHLPTSEDFDQGHRLGSERHFTERHERSRPSDGLFSAKVRWGDKKGGYGEHYWDLNHAGHAGNHGGDDYSGNHSDDGSYHDHDSPSSHSSYDGPSDHSYGSSDGSSDDYDPEKSSYEENGRAKRAHPRIKPERIQKQQHHDEDENEEDEEEATRPRNRKHKQQSQESKSDEDSYSDEKEDEEEQRVYKKNKRPQHRHKQEEEETTDAPPPPKEPKKKVVLVVQENDNQEKNTYTPNVANRQADYNKYVPYEGGAGVRQHHHPEVQAAASVPIPRLFLEPTTGHVVDRATGQAYVLQPIAALGYN